MNFDFTEEQTMLQQMTRELLAGESAPTQVRALAETPEGYSTETWRKLADLGLLGIAIPEAYGGQGLDMIEQALVLEEMGRSAFPGPYFASVVLAATALIHGGGEELKRRYLPGLAAGQIKATLALLEETPDWSPRAVSLIAHPRDGGWILSGVKWLVPFGEVADLFIVAAQTEAETTHTSPDGGAHHGITLFAIPRSSPGIETCPLSTFDLTNRVSQVTFKDVRVSPEQVLGDTDRGESLLDAVLERAAVAASAEMLGAARKCLEMAVEYAKTREQFGQAIGSFQAIKHKCADMYVDVEESHAATYYAAWALAAQAANASLAASVAKAYVSDAAKKVCSDAIQVHGGIGFTWDYDLHIYFKRAKHLEPLYGDADFHRERALRLALAEMAAPEAGATAPRTKT